MYIKTIYKTLLNSILLFLIFPTTVLFASNDELRNETGKQIKEVLDVWIQIGSASMILVIIAGAAIMIISGDNPKRRTIGKSTVLGAGITITLLYSTYVIVELVLKIFGMSLF